LVGSSVTIVASTGGSLVDADYHAIAPAVNCGDDLLSPAIVTDAPPRGLDPAGECRFTDESMSPDRVEQFLFGDHTVSIAGQMYQYVEHLGLNRDAPTGATDLVAFQVELHIRERKYRIAVSDRFATCM